MQSTCRTSSSSVVPPLATAAGLWDSRRSAWQGGLAKLGVQQCTVVGFSYGAVVAFRLAELQPELVESVVATCSGPVLTESLTRECLERLGFPTWSEFLLPDSASALKKLLEIGSFHFPRLPKCVFKHALEPWGDQLPTKRGVETSSERRRPLARPRLVNRASPRLS
ncbi:uncharacterized protein LOC120296101 [Eucalyptus grandis]|uniref:uncharacterized protein LOC120296101 n=1 Tax=Eucalyptus grandis TaxID=71139 RepID=UPI00192EB8AE|nr:uncharacterized protein LOC120296101 [Eucalyptus grandis]